jgi:hypothetical protein
MTTTRFVLTDPEGKLLRFLVGEYGHTIVREIHATPNNRFQQVMVATEANGLEASHRHVFEIEVDGMPYEIASEISAEEYGAMGKLPVLSTMSIAVKLPADGIDWSVEFLMTGPVSKGGKITYAEASAETEDGSVHTLPEVLQTYYIDEFEAGTGPNPG